MAASLVSRFFATRSIHNLWGLTSHKTIIDKSTYGRLEWLMSVFIDLLFSRSRLNAKRLPHLR
jgi:hypothetical protein